MELTIRELEAQVKELKEKKRLEDLNSELTKYLLMKNKCFATHTFARQVNHSTYGGISARLRKVIDVYLKDNTVMYSLENIEYNRNEPTNYLSFVVNQNTA